jgi:mono/diheme cytochrome c family protein
MLCAGRNRGIEMNPRPLVGICALLAAVTALGSLPRASGGSDAAFDSVLADMGSEYYVRYCAACHGANAKGEGPVAGALKVRPPDLTRIAARRGGAFPDAEIARMIDGRFSIAAHGSREMPVWGERFGATIPEAGVSEEIVRGRVLVLVEYLKSIQTHD